MEGRWRWRSRIVDIFARGVQSSSTPRLSTLLDLDRLIEWRPAYFQWMTWDLEIEHRFGEPKFPALAYAKHKREGFWGAHLNVEDHVVVAEDGTPPRFDYLNEQQLWDLIQAHVECLVATHSVASPMIPHPWG